MFYVALGVLGFLVIHLFHLIALKKLSLAKPLTWALGSGLVIYATVSICLSGGKLALPSWITILGWGMLAASLSLLFYSLYYNLPFSKTYISNGGGDRLVTTGLYALVRHPWLLFYILFLLSLLLASHSSLLLVAAPVWLALNVLLAFIQDRYVFGRMFPDYREYRQRTPMLWPNRKSFRAFMGQFKWPRGVTKIIGGTTK
jgi:protein-S-isoprenylcysteine O-methyltransferase Ste14